MKKILLIILGIIIGFIGATFMEQSFGADLLVEKCPVCDCKITAQRIIDDNPLIELPNETVSFKYNGEVFTKKMLEEAKIINER